MTRSLRLFVPILWTVACTADLSELTVEPAAPLTTDTLRLAVGDVDGISVSWFVDGEEVVELRDALEVEADRTARGQTWTAHVWGRPDADRTSVPGAVYEVVIGNSAPTVTSAALSPEVPRTTDAVQATFVGEDADGDRLLWRLQWLKNGEVVKGLGGERLSPELTTRGETWTVRGWVSDGDIEIGPEEVSVMIDNVAPVAQVVRLSPGEAFEETELVATAAGVDDDGDPIDWSYAWLVDGEEVAGANGPTLDGASFDKGQAVQVVATPSDGFVSGAPMTSEAVVIGNTAPSATGARIEPAAPTETDTVSCIGEGFADVDGDVEGWQVAWTVDGVAAGTSITLDGSAFSRDQVVGCTLVPFDGELAGEAVFAAPVTVLNTAPVLASAAIDPASPVTTDVLSAALGEATDVDGDTVSYAYAWTVDGSPAGIDATLPASAFARDQIVGLTVTPTDGTDAGAPVLAATVTVLNSAPVISDVTMSPSAPRTEDAITASVTASDADDDSITYTYTWSVDGVEVSGEAAATLPASAFAKGEAVSVTVVPSDGTDDGSAFTSAAVTIVNTPPTLAAATLSPSTVREGDTVTCAPSGYDDLDGDPASYTYAWTVDGLNAGVTTATLDGASFDRGQEVICTVTPSDGTDDGSPVDSAALVIANTAPAVASVSLSSTSPTTEDDLVATASGVADVDGDAVELTWVWTVDGSTVRTFTGPATSDTLPASEFTRGEAVFVTVTPADDADAGSAVVSATATVVNSAPVVSALALSPTAPGTEDAVTATPTATDADGDGLTYTYTWTVDGSVVTGETGPTLGASFFVKGQAIGASVVANDGADDSAAFASSAVTVVNTAPTLASASISPSTVREGDTATCVPAGFDDVDGDTASYTYAWTVDGVDTGVTTATLGGASFGRGQAIACTVTPGDGTDSGAPVTASAVSIANTAPSVASVSLSSTSPTSEEDLVATASGVADVDGDVVELTWVWTVDGSTVRTFTGSATSDTLPASETTRGDVVVVTVTPADDADSGAPVSSAPATVVNSAPKIGAVTLSPSDVYTNTDLTASVSATDPDGDSLTTTWVWKVNGTTLSETGSVLSSTNFAKDDTVTVEATVGDGTDSAGPVASSVTVLNTLPKGGAVALSGETPTDDLVCSVSSLSTDLDGDSLTYMVSWELDGVAWTGSVSTGTRTGDTISSADTAWGDEWQCFVTVDDGDGSIELASGVQGIVPVDPDIVYGSGSGSTVWRGGSDSATWSIADGCPADQYLVGIRAEMYSSGVWVGAANRCAPIEVTCDLDDCTVSTGTITTGTMRKGTSGTRTETRDCPDGQVVTGWTGRSGSITDLVTLRCRPLTATFDGTSWTADIGTSATDLSPMGYAAGGTAYSRADCLSTSSIRTAAVQINHYWNSGGYVGFSMFCREPDALE